MLASRAPVACFAACPRMREGPAEWFRVRNSAFRPRSAIARFRFFFKRSTRVYREGPPAGHSDGLATRLDCTGVREGVVGHARWALGLIGGQGTCLIVAPAGVRGDTDASTAWFRSDGSLLQRSEVVPRFSFFASPRHFHGFIWFFSATRTWNHRRHVPLCPYAPSELHSPGALTHGMGHGGNRPREKDVDGMRDANHARRDPRRNNDRTRNRNRHGGIGMKSWKTAFVVCALFISLTMPASASADRGSRTDYQQHQSWHHGKHRGHYKHHKSWRHRKPHRHHHRHKSWHHGKHRRHHHHHHHQGSWRHR